MKSNTNLLSEQVSLCDTDDIKKPAAPSFRSNETSFKYEFDDASAFIEMATDDKLVIVRRMGEPTSLMLKIVKRMRH